jgi:hypothetical protein
MNYAKLDHVESARIDQDERIRLTGDEIEKLRQTIELLQQNVRTEIVTAVKRITNKMQPNSANESKPTIIVSQALDEKGYRCGSNSP